MNAKNENTCKKGILPTAPLAAVLLGLLLPLLPLTLVLPLLLASSLFWIRNSFDSSLNPPPLTSLFDGVLNMCSRTRSLDMRAKTKVINWIHVMRSTSNN